jgi:hypothetical protein
MSSATADTVEHVAAVRAEGYGVDVTAAGAECRATTPNRDDMAMAIPLPMYVAFVFERPRRSRRPR